MTQEGPDTHRRGVVWPQGEGWRDHPHPRQLAGGRHLSSTFLVAGIQATCGPHLCTTLQTDMEFLNKSNTARFPPTPKHTLISAGEQQVMAQTHADGPQSVSDTCSESPDSDSA